MKNQYAGDTKASLIRVIDSKQRPKNGSPCEKEPTHRIVFSNLEEKSYYQRISCQMKFNSGHKPDN